ncbi:hypothetical protein SDC9_113098 [bioreactor metagenome]|uniref:Uncharacterized protein n=1 Tax=bioreactor metagenome TaxID=1076179 RepID=A0A645BNN9_9ZZZZ
MEYLKGREMALLQILSAGENRSSETIETQCIVIV